MLSAYLLTPASVPSSVPRSRLLSEWPAVLTAIDICAIGMSRRLSTTLKEMIMVTSRLFATLRGVRRQRLRGTENNVQLAFIYLAPKREGFGTKNARLFVHASSYVGVPNPSAASTSYSNAPCAHAGGGTPPRRVVSNASCADELSRSHPHQALPSSPRQRGLTHLASPRKNRSTFEPQSAQGWHSA